jgi:hypothetical protein
MSAQSVDRLSSLPHQKSAGLQHCGGLLPRRLNRDEAHGAGHRFADGLRVARIRFAALDEGFDIRWWNEPHLRTESCDLTPNSGR